jgi:cytosine/adenosine deaminase-related metal-dependent hydrolase
VSALVSGLVNAHTHLYSGLAPFGIPAPSEAPQDFLQILERVWWRLDRGLDERSLRAAARYYVCEALLAGTTALIDHHESPDFIESSLDVLADACQDLGMRAVLCYGATERNGGRTEARRGLAECRRFVLSNRRPLVRGVVGLHASFTVSDESIRDACGLCRDLGVVLHVHLAEDVADVSDARRRGYVGPLERLIALDALPPGSLLAHGVHLSSEQVRMAEDRGCWLLQNPRSNRNNRVGYPRALRDADRVALGTDGFPADMVDEFDTLRVCATGFDDDLVRAERRLFAGGRLVAGLFGERDVPPTPEAADWRDWAQRRQRQCRERLVVDGRTVVERGRLMTADAASILEEARSEAARLWARMTELQ